MKSLIFIIYLVFLAYSQNSQTFNFYRTSPAVIYTNDTFGVISNGKVNNLTNSINQIRIIRTVVNVPQGWETCICDIVQCHPPGIDTAIANYPPGLSDIAVMLYAHSVPGTGYVTFRAEKVSNTNENHTVTFGGSFSPIGVTQISNEIPGKFELSQNYPNPFNPYTNLGFAIPDLRFVTLAIFDILGREITKIVNEELKAGIYEVEWDASNYPSGVYYYKLMAYPSDRSKRSDGYSETKKMVLVK